VRYQFIKQYQGQFSTSALCRAMNVSRSGYDAWSKPDPSQRELANLQLTEQSKSVFQESNQTYGSPRIYAELKAQRQSICQ
jgi:hypothetical protein